MSVLYAYRCAGCQENYTSDDLMEGEAACPLCGEPPMYSHALSRWCERCDAALVNPKVFQDYCDECTEFLNQPLAPLEPITVRPREFSADFKREIADITERATLIDAGRGHLVRP